MVWDCDKIGYYEGGKTVAGRKRDIEQIVCLGGYSMTSFIDSRRDAYAKSRAEA